MMVAQDIDQEILELTQKLPTLSDKVILDMVNGIEVSRDHIRVRANRGGFPKSLGCVDRKIPSPSAAN